MPDRRATRDQRKDIKLQLGEQLSFIVVTYGKNDPKQYHKKHPKQQQQQQIKNHSLARVKKQEAWSTHYTAFKLFHRVVSLFLVTRLALSFPGVSACLNLFQAAQHV